MGLNTGEIIAIFIIVIVLLIIALIACYKCWRSMTKMHRDSSKPNRNFVRNLQQSFRRSLRRVGRGAQSETSQIPVSYHRQRATPHVTPPRVMNLDDPASERSEIHPRYLPHHRRSDAGGDAPPTYAEALTHQKVEDRGRRNPGSQSNTSSHSLNTISSHIPYHSSPYHTQPLYAVPTRQKARQQYDQQPLHVPTGLVYSGPKFSKPPKPPRNKLKNLQFLKYLTRKDDSGSEYASTDSTSDGEEERVELDSIYSERYIGTPNEFNKMTPHFLTYNERYVGSPTEVDSSYREMRDEYLEEQRLFHETPVKRAREDSRRKKTSSADQEEHYAVPYAKTKTARSSGREYLRHHGNVNFVNENSHQNTRDKGYFKGWTESYLFERKPEINQNGHQTGYSETEENSDSHRNEPKQRAIGSSYVGRTGAPAEVDGRSYGQGPAYFESTGVKNYHGHSSKHPNADSQRSVDSHEILAKKINGRSQCYDNNSISGSQRSVGSSHMITNSATRQPSEITGRSDSDSCRTNPFAPSSNLRSMDSHLVPDGSNRGVCKEHRVRNVNEVRNSFNPMLGPLRALDGEEVIAGSIAQGQIIPSMDLKFEGSAFVPVVSRRQRNSKQPDEHFKVVCDPARQNNVVFNQDVDSIGLDTYI